jgi:hypothetical protein
MRFLGSLVFALMFAAAAQAAEPARVGDILRQPSAFVDRQLAVVGIMGHGSNGYWAICPFPEDRAQSGPVTPEHPICIQLRRHDGDDLETHEEKYRGAIAMITGPYWNRCLPDIREHEPEVVREECKDWGVTGFLGVEAIAIRGYSDPTQLINGQFGESWAARDPVLEISPQSEAAAGIDAFVQKFLPAVRARDANALALLYPEELRGFARVGFGVPTTRLYWYVLSPEMAVTSENARHRGTGYRVYGGEREAHVCFCRRSDCTRQWPRTTDDVYAINIASPTVCHSLQRIRGTWWYRG